MGAQLDAALRALFGAKARSSVAACARPPRVSLRDASIFKKLSPFESESGDLHVVIDTAKGSRNKFAWDEELELFELGGVLPAGAVFPYDFGFIPNTRGEDGDAIDVLVLMDEPAFSGCLVGSRLLGGD